MSYENDLDVTAFSSPKRAGVISDELLNNLRAAESSNRSWVTHPESGAMGAYQHLPTTVEMLAKKYGKYNPYNEPEARERTRQYLEELATSNKGDLTKTLKQYGGFVKQDATKYIEKILGKSPTDPDIEAFTYKPTQEKEETGAAFGNPNLTRQGQRAGVTGLTSESAKRFEDIATLPYQATVPIAAIAKGVVQSIPEAVKTGQAPAPIGEKIATEFLNKYQYQPQTDVLEPLQKLPEKILGSSMTPPLPELAGYANAPKLPISPVAQDLAQQFARKATPVVGAGREALGTAQEAIQAARTGVPVVAETPKPPMAGVGAALTTKQNAVNSIIPNLSPETQAIIKSSPIENVNLPALETKALEENLGIRLSKSQRMGDNQGYASEWNARDTDRKIQKLFSEQPQQFVDAFEKIKDRHVADIGELTKENIGQLEINALVAKDKLRTEAINNAKKALVDANGGEFPVDIGTLKENINNALSSNYKSRYLSDALKGDLEDFYKNPTFEAYEHIRSNLADEMRTAKDGKSRQAAYIARDELEKLPVFGENGGSPEARKLKSLADTYRRLNVERYNVIKTNPAYKAAIKEAIDAQDAGAMESLHAANFHDKFVTGKTATPESVRRMMEELKDNPDAVKAIRAGDIINAENALVPNKLTPQLRPDAYNTYLRNQADKTKYIHDAKSAQDLLNIGILSSKVAKPAENVFNFSNSYSAYLGDLMKQGIQLKGEGALATATKGASIIPMQMLKGAAEFINKNKFANETTHPHAGIINKD